MRNNHRTPQPAPRALCAAFAPLLPLLSLDALDREEATAVAEHLRTCDYCQREMADYGALRDAILREDARDAEADGGMLALSLAEVRRAADREEEAESLVFDGPAPWRERPNVPIPWLERFRVPVPRRSMGVVNVFEALAAVLVIALLGGLLAWHGSAGPTHLPTPTPTATQDPVSQAYVDLLRAYYVPLAETYTPAMTCFTNTLSSQSVTGSDLATCRAQTQTELAAAQALSAHLDGAIPPPRWQTHHAALKAATQYVITVTTKQLQAIDAQSLALITDTRGPGIDMGAAFCDPITQINAGPPRLNPPLLAMQQGINANGITCAP